MPIKARKRLIARALVLTMLLMACSASFFVSTKKAEAANCGDVLVSGSSWAGGNGVDVHSNAPYDGDVSGNSCAGSTEVFNLSANPPQYGYGWQCVELAARMYATRGWGTGLKTVPDAAHIYTNASSLGFTAMANGSITLANIVPGDMIVTHEATYGHVMLVDSISGNSINVVDQNGNDGGRSTVTYTSSTQTLRDGSYYQISGVVHSPNNHLTNPPPVTPTPPPPPPPFNSPITSSSTSHGSSLWNGQTMYTDQYLVSSNGLVALYLQWDCNLLLFNGHSLLWASGTNANSISSCFLITQNDGNVVLYRNGSPVWATGTNNTAVLTLQDDGNLVGYTSDWHSTWASGTTSQPTYNYYGSDSISTGSGMYTGQYLRSGDGTKFMLLQPDCNLLVYGPGYNVLWATNTGGSNQSCSLWVQGDGNIVLYKNDSAVWATGTNDSNRLTIQTNGNLVAYNSSGYRTWSSGAWERIGALTSSGTFIVKEGALDTQWDSEYGGLSQGVVSGSLIGVVTGGTFLVKQGALNNGWTSESSGVTSGVLSDATASTPLCIGVLTSTGEFFVKEGSLSAPWTDEYSGVVAGYLSGSRIGVLTSSGSFLVKDGGLSAPWVDEYDGVSQGVLSGSLIGALTTSGTFLVKQGDLSASWTSESSGVTSGTLSDATSNTALRIGVLTSSGSFLVKEGGLSASWVDEYDGASQGIISGNLIGVLTSGTFLAKQGALDAPWVNEYIGVTSCSLWSNG